MVQIPCGRVQGHGEYCDKLRLCGTCEEIARLRREVGSLKALLAELGQFKLSTAEKVALARKAAGEGDPCPRCGYPAQDQCDNPDCNKALRGEIATLQGALTSVTSIGAEWHTRAEKAESEAARLKAALEAVTAERDSLRQELDGVLKMIGDAGGDT